MNTQITSNLVVLPFASLFYQFGTYHLALIKSSQENFEAVMPHLHPAY
jgi:hypothetical protein